MKHVLSIVLALVVAACGASSPPPPAVKSESPAPSPLTEKLDAAVVKTLAGRPAPGVSVAVLHAGEVVLARGYGTSDVAAGTPVTTDTVFRIGSLTKSFTAAAILKLVAAGKVAIDDPITKYLPDYPLHGKTVTVRHLLTHTSGIHSYTAMDVFHRRMNEAFSRSEMVAMFSAEPFDFEPGARWAYNNSGYYLLGLIIEKVTGEPYAEAVQRLVIEPAGLKATAYCPPEMTGTTYSRGYGMGEGGPELAEPLNMEHPYAAGSLCSTATDIARWMAALAADRAAFAQMTVPVKLTDGSTHDYGFGLQIGNFEGRREIHHGGGINGFVSLMSYYPEEDLIIVVLSNLEGPLAGDLTQILARAYFGIPEPVEKKISEAEAAPFVGTYDITLPGETIRIALRYQNGTLETANLDEHGKPGPWLPASWQDDNVFEIKQVKAKLTFTVENGKATRIQVEQGGQSFTATRVAD